MAATTVQTFGVKEFHANQSAEDAAAEQIRLIGYAVIPDVLSALELGDLQRKLDAVYQEQVKEVGGEDRLATMGDTHTVRLPLAYDEAFLSVAANATVLSVVERILGDYFILMLQNGVLNMPQRGSTQNTANWHRDLNYQHFICTPPLSVSALFCVDDFSAETGGTNVLPGSHKTDKFPSHDYVLAHETQIEAKAGSVLIFDSMLYHRGGINRSPGVRRGINHMYTLAILKQQISMPRMLGGKYSEDPFFARFLGYDSEPDDSVVEFRRKRIARVSNS
jgi:ectoine hydroxylase-related dioxygenase (phytanoyl-CoA dioxygenase family)